MALFPNYKERGWEVHNHKTRGNMKALPRILTVGSFEPCNLVMSTVEYETPLSNRQRSALVKRTRRFCAKHCSGSRNRVQLEFDGTTIRIKQHAVPSTKPFTKFHFSMLLNQKLGGPLPDKAPQDQARTQTEQVLTSVSA